MDEKNKRRSVIDLKPALEEIRERNLTRHALDALDAEWTRPAVPFPSDDLELLKNAALGETGQSRSVRYLLFLLPDLDEPSGFKGEGLKELRALDGKLADSFLKVLLWWRDRAEDLPLYEVLEMLEGRFSESEVKR